MYWTDWGNPPKIERSGMDGTVRTTVIDVNLTWPNCLAMDRELQKLYWTDAGTRKIEVSDLDGKNRQVNNITITLKIYLTLRFKLKYISLHIYAYFLVYFSV